MSTAIIVTFVSVFALVLIAVSLGTKFFEAQRRKNVSTMLKAVEGAPAAVAETKILKDDAAPDATVVERVLTKLNLGDRTKAELQQSGLGWSPAQLVTNMGIGAVAGAVAGIVIPTITHKPLTYWLIAMACLGAVAPYLYMRRKRSKRMAQFEEQFPDALDFLARSMRAGHAFSISLEMLGEELGEPLGGEFRTLFNEQNLGAPLDVALRNLTLRVPLLDVRFFASSVLLQKQTGGNLSEILVRLAYVIRERFRLKGQVRAASAHGRMTAAILTALPVVTMLALLVVAPGYLQSMAHDPDGKYLIMGALGAQLVGNYCIKKIIDIKV